MTEKRLPTYAEAEEATKHEGAPALHKFIWVHQPGTLTSPPYTERWRRDLLAALEEWNALEPLDEPERRDYVEEWCEDCANRTICIAGMTHASCTYTDEDMRRGDGPILAPTHWRKQKTKETGQ